MNVLLGSMSHSMDGKNRIRIPSKFKSELTEGNQKLHFVQLSENCIAVMNDTGLKARFGDFENVDLTDEETLEALRDFSEKVEDIEEDAQGRVTLSKAVREHIGADKDHSNLIAIGMIGFIEIWTEERREAYKSKKSAKEVQEKLSKAKKKEKSEQAS